MSIRKRRGQLPPAEAARRTATRHASSCLEGYSDKDLLLFSGHTNLRTLKKYLEWGLRSADMARRMRAGNTQAVLNGIANP